MTGGAASWTALEAPNLERDVMARSPQVTISPCDSHFRGKG